ncbi:MAG: hypothetical protein QF415_13645 [Candidatus Undinarchaeales archaeon]|jgi:hypothetical protein|nr:hypothetical protein [Candidatus Undinarchaeales archaeon]MDP7494307.1 hypothetical protein [Candidatus Undinarchaeales archaeon]
MMPHPDEETLLTAPTSLHEADEALIDTFLDYRGAYGPEIGASGMSGSERWDHSKEHAIADLWSDEGVNDFRPTII